MNISFTGDKKRRSSRARSPTTIHSLQHEILCTIFSFLDFFDLISSSAVCKTWSTVINKSKLLQVFCRKQWQMGLAGGLAMGLVMVLRNLGRFFWRRWLWSVINWRLHEGRIRVDHLRGHSLLGIAFILLNVQFTFLRILFGVMQLL